MALYFNSGLLTAHSKYIRSVAYRQLHLNRVSLKHDGTARTCKSRNLRPQEERWDD